MRILYGVCGHGMGHATRAPVAVSYLQRQGHDVRVLTTSPATADYLDARLASPASPTIRALGLSVIYRDNAVRHLETFVDAALRLTVMPLANLPALGEVLAFKPNVVVTDFEGWSAFVAQRLSIPIVTLDNIHFTSRCEHDPSILSAASERASARIQRLLTDAFPHAAHYMVMAMARPLSVLPRTTLHLPLLRSEVLQARWHKEHSWRYRGAIQGYKLRHQQAHLTCYFSGSLDHNAIRAELNASGVLCRYFGDPMVDRPTQYGTVTSLPYSEGGFLDSLVSGRGVISGAGFTLLSECAYLGIPVLAVPIAQQHEQELCGAYLERLGYGHVALGITRGVVQSFVDELPTLRKRLREYKHDDNRECLQALDSLVRSGGRNVAA